MDASKLTGSAVEDAGEQLRLLASELEAARREELQRLQLQHFEKVRQVESGRLHAEEELEALEDRFTELDELYRVETARLNAALERAKDEVLASVKSLGEQNKKLARVEGLRDDLDRERGALLERIQNEELRGAESRKRLEAAHRMLVEKIETLEAELVVSHDARRQLELARIELNGRVVALEAQRDDFENERKDWHQRLNAAAERNAEDRQRLEVDKTLLAEQVDQLKTETHALRVNVDLLDGEVRTLEQQRDRLANEKQMQGGKIDLLIDEKKTLSGKIDLLDEEMRVQADRAQQLWQERAFYRQAMVAAEQRVRAAEMGVRHRFGKAMATSFSSWRGFVRLPSAVWAALRDPSSSPGSVVDGWLAQIEDVFAKQGSTAGEDFVRIHAVAQADLAAGLTKLARLTARHDAYAALPFASEAAQVDPRPFRRKWLAFMKFDAGYIEAAHDLLESLPEQVEFKASEKNKAEYIAGCYRLLHHTFAWPAVKAKPDYEPAPGRILYVAASSLPYHVTGYTLRTHGLLTALKAKGLDIRCVTRPGYPADRADSKSTDGVGVETIDGVAYEVLPGPHRRKLGLDTYLQKSAEILAEKAMAESVAVIHAASNYEAALPALMAARMLGIPFVYEVRGLWEYTSASKKSGWERSERFDLDRRLESQTAASADHVLTLTEALSTELESRGVDKRNITLAPNSIDVDTFAAAPRKADLAQSLGVEDDHFVIGYVGSVVAYEGLDDLVEALFLLKDRLPRARVLVVGEGDALPALRELAQARKVDDRILFCGKVAPGQVRDYYALMHAITLPRKPVTVCQLVSPLKPLEAMALGIPLIVSDVAALKEMVKDGETALVHLAGNARSLADSIEILAKNPALQRTLAENGHNDVTANRTWKQVASTIAVMYAQLAKAEAACSAMNASVRPQGDLSPLQIAAGKHALNEQERLLLDKKLAFALRQGVVVLRAFLSEQCQGGSKRLVAYLCLRAAQACLDAGEEAEAVALGEAALQEDRSITSLRGAARLFHNAARLEVAQELVTQLEHSLGEIKPNDRKFIDEILGRAQLVTLAGLPAQPRALKPHPQRVLNILAFSLPYTSVGYATRSHGLAIGVKNAGWDVRPYTRPGFPYDFKTELEGQVLPNEDHIDGVTYGRIFDFSRKGMNEVDYMLAAVEHYESVIRKEQPEIVHAASNYVTALPALIAARRLGVPFIYEVRGFWEVTRSSRDDKFENTPKYRFMQLFEALTARHADHVITITTAMKEELIARGVSEERISIAYNSVDPDRFIPRAANLELAAELGIPRGTPVIGYVGSFVDYEGLDDLIGACAGLKAAGRDFRLLLVGDGAVFEDLKRQVEAEGLQDKTIMTGRVPHDMVEDYYTLIDIAPFPRKPWEVCELVSPLKPYEAMALEKAVIVSGTRALVEIVTHEKNGLVFAKGDLADLQRKLDELLMNPETRAQLGRAAREWIRQERSWDVAGRVCGEVYAELTKVGMK
jgi:glycosyltransferase involved in cell wall biosynthesis